MFPSMAWLLSKCGVKHCDDAKSLYCVFFGIAVFILVGVNALMVSGNNRPGLRQSVITTLNLLCLVGPNKYRTCLGDTNIWFGHQRGNKVGLG